MQASNQVCLFFFVHVGNLGKDEIEMRRKKMSKWEMKVVWRRQDDSVGWRN